MAANPPIGRVHIVRKAVLLAVFISLAVVATAMLLIRRHILRETAHVAAVPAEHAGGSNVMTQPRSHVAPQQEPRSSVEEEVEPSYWKDSGVGFADWKDHEMWKRTSECRAVMDELNRIAKAADARGYLTSNEVESLIAYMRSPHFAARSIAVTVAEAGRSEPARSLLMPHVLNLLADPVPLVRLSAAFALGEMGDKTAIPYLKPLLSDRPLIAKRAAEAIDKLERQKSPQ
jgi:hypothetical protein